jgi:hypothetical protein
LSADIQLAEFFQVDFRQCGDIFFPAAAVWFGG